MNKNEVHAVTGAFGYSGRYIATRLLEQGRKVVTLTNSVDRANPFGGRIRAVPLSFGEPDKLAAGLAGVDVLYNTYWVRFNHGMFTHGEAVQNTLVLFEAARRAGVRRVVHVSITNPSEDSPLDYFAGKARLERALRESGLSHAILRPTVLFGREDILVNNIAWALRRFPFFAVFGDGSYRLQPIHVDDLAELAVAEGMQSENVVVNAIGPETFTYRALVKAVCGAIAQCFARSGVFAGKTAGMVQARCIHHARGNSRVDVRTALREHPAHRENAVDGLDEEERRHIGAAICQRTGTPSQPADALFCENASRSLLRRGPVGVILKPRNIHISRRRYWTVSIS
jgi:NADH dehydrogenase